MSKLIPYLLVIFLIVSISRLPFHVHFVSHEETFPIPRTIHIVTRSPEDVLFQKQWKRLYPTWSLRVWTDSEIETYLRKNRPEFLPTIQRLVGAKKSDFFRLLILHLEGGVYADADVEPVRNFEGWFRAHPAPCYFTEETDLHKLSLYHTRLNETLPCNFLLAADKHNEEFFQLANHIHNISETDLGREDATAQTGPGLLKRNLPMLRRCRILPAKLFSGYSSSQNTGIREYCKAPETLPYEGQSLCCSLLESWKLHARLKGLRSCTKFAKVQPRVEAYALHHWRNTWSQDAWRNE